MSQLNRELWKSALEYSSNEELVKLDKLPGLSIKIPGFRKLDPKNRQIRPKLLQILLQPNHLLALTKACNEWVQQEEAMLSYREMNVEELIRSVQQGASPHAVFCSLLSSVEERHMELAESLIQYLKESGIAQESDKPQAESGGTSSAKNDGNEKKLEELEKKIGKFEKQIIELQNQLNQAKQESAKERKKWKEEKSEYDSKIGNLNQMVSARDKTIKSLEEEVNRYKKENDAKDEALTQKDQEIARLHALCLHLSTTQGQQGEKEEASREKNLLPTGGIPREAAAPTQVALVGNPLNSFYKRLTRYQVHIVEASELDEESGIEAIKSADEVWLLTFRVNRRKQQLVQSSIEPEKLQVFHDLLSLQKYAASHK